MQGAEQNCNASQCLCLESTYMQYAKSVHGVMISTNMPCYAILHNMVGSYHYIH